MSWLARVPVRADLEPVDRAARAADGSGVRAVGGPYVPSPASRGPVAFAGRSVAWRHAVERAVELAAFPGPVLVVGERGTGKTCLARELLGGHLVVDAAEGEVGDALGGLTGNRPLVLRHAERPAQCDVAALNALLDARPDVPLPGHLHPGDTPGPMPPAAPGHPGRTLGHPARAA
ncbi:hypothetical protein [Streptomyces sp. TRM68367]|uniref:hypothetical protein n=1 Tax=Streptomyces sp. TRM68367 TaxID=2758415 RepID=UPI0037DC4CF4